jgi:polar amino acid transport system permease protein
LESAPIPLQSLLSFGAGGWGDELFHGALHTIGLAFTAVPIGLAGGLLLGFARAAQEPTLRLAANLLSSVFRGLPELLTILLVYFLGQRLLNAAVAFAGGGIAQDISIFWAGVVALSMVFAAYASEVFLGSLKALRSSHLQAAAALGLGPIVTLRFITLPEIFRLSAPGLSNLWLSLLKQTSLMSVIGYDDLLHSGYIAASSTGERIFFYAVVFVLYLLLCAAGAPLFERLIYAASAKIPARS